MRQCYRCSQLNAIDLSYGIVWLPAFHGWQVGSSLGVADVAMGGVLLPLWSKILGVELQEKLPATSAWLKAIVGQEGMADAVGTCLGLDAMGVGNHE